MKAQSIYQYIWVGTSLRFLQDAKEGFLVHGSGWVISNIDEFLSWIDKFGLHVTKRASHSLNEFREEIYKKPLDYKLTNEESLRLNKIIKELRETLLAESAEKYIYVVSEKRIWVEKLLNDAESLLRPGAYSKMSLIAQYDFREGCLCIAFERPTAAAYHLLRAMEETIRQYYLHQVKYKRLEKLLWKNIIDDLQKKKKITPQLYGRIDYIRSAYRNPTDHPEMVYDIEEAQDLFGVCVECIHKLMQDINLI